ncbi:MAG: FAD-binding protein [Christensenellales bacterium]|jgi:succinate dehydrogenase/fumarate reductase flavoprotein subunit
MITRQIKISGLDIPVYGIDTIIIGTGCAGYNAADWLYDLGRRDLAIITEGVNMGTSRNTGSDKQTYYKLSLASDGSDSVREMAQTLFSGGGVNGDTALIEAACSVKSFIKLANLGVPFPTNPYGEYVGYKTDHDPRQRATSAGPLTSKYMTECLQRSVEKKGIKIFDGMQAVKLLKDGGKVCGILCVDMAMADEENMGFTIFAVNNVIMATGGPAGVYYNSVFPESQTGGTGLALEAGAVGNNLHEWQYGLASTKFRWNVSGTYQQVLPKYIAVDKDGNEREFLLDYFDDPKKALDMVFLKGYQWPFDVTKVNGSSIIDIIVHNEVFGKGNRVFMDFRSEPAGLENGFEGLADETYNYLKNSNALIELPIARLAKMNTKAIELYRSNGIDLYSEPLEVSVCAQHNNGGIAVDMNWQSNIEGLYIAGEAAGTFGTFRPGGSALNSAQVGSMRAAEHIAFSKDEAAPEGELCAETLGDISSLLENVKGVEVKPGESNVVEKRLEMQKLMSDVAAHIRRPKGIEQAKKEISSRLSGFFGDVKISSKREVAHMLRNRDIMITQLTVLESIGKVSQEIGSKGSGLVIDENGRQIMPSLSDFSYKPGAEGFSGVALAAEYGDGSASCEFRPIRPMPKGDDWFENVWNDYIIRTQRVHK